MIESHEEALERLRENLANVVPGGTLILDTELMEYLVAHPPFMQELTEKFKRGWTP
jgi:hypothetical protein